MVTLSGVINANLMSLEQAIGVMLGQEIGTTITGRMIAFEIGNIRHVAIALGILLLEFGEKRKWQRYGQVLLGFGPNFAGMETMSGAPKLLAQNPVIAGWLAQMGTSPLLAIVAGALITDLLQSSSAMTALVIAMGARNVITLPGVIGLIYGANIGSCVAGPIASVRTSPIARRALRPQIIINVLGVLLFLPFIRTYANLLEGTAVDLPRQIANAHTIVDVAVSLVLFPFVKQIRLLASRLVPAPEAPEEERVTRFVNDTVRGLPSAAIMESSRELSRLGQTALDMLGLAQDALVAKDSVKAEEALRLERELADPLCDAIEQLVDAVIAQELDSREQKRCLQLKNINVDLAWQITLRTLPRLRSIASITTFP